MGWPRWLRPLAAAGQAAMAFGCAGSGTLTGPPASFRNLAGVPADHGLDAEGRSVIGNMT